MADEMEVLAESVLAAEPPAEAETPETEVVAQVEGETPEAEGDDEKPENTRKSRAAKQREFLRARAETEAKRADDLLALRDRIVNASKSEEAPKEADFTDYSDFIAAKAVWASVQSSAKREVKNAEDEAQAARTAVSRIEAEQYQADLDAYNEQARAAKTRYADFEAVITAPHVQFPPSAPLTRMVMASDVAADLAYAIAKDPALNDRLLKLPPIEAARAIGRLEASLSAPKARTETKAPAPISPVRGSAGAASNIDRMTNEEYRAARASGKIR